MESFSEPAVQLAELSRLKEATRHESLRGRRWALPILAAGLILFFASYSLSSGIQRLAAPFMWTVFLVGWLIWLRSANRARPRRLDGHNWRLRLPLLLGFLVVSNLIVAIGSRVSWVLVGVLIALVSTCGGVIARLRSGQ